MSKAERLARTHGLIFYIVSLVIAEFIILMAASVRGVIGMMIAIAGGVGYWFLIRRFWRRLASDSPDSGFVRGGLRMSPRTRKAISGAICAFLLLMNMGVASYDPSQVATGNSSAEVAAQAAGDAGSSSDAVEAGSAKQDDGSDNAGDATSEEKGQATENASSPSDATEADSGQRGSGSDNSDSVPTASVPKTNDDFIDAYNSLTDTPFVKEADNTANDKDSPYYRTEFRLPAFKDASGVHGSIGGASADIVCYGGSWGREKCVRVYVDDKDSEELAGIFRTCVEVLCPNASEEDREAYESEVIEQQKDGYDPSLASGNYEGIDLNGYLQHRSLVIENTKGE